MDEPSSQKLKIKIGNAEFEAEGPTELLKDQFERFMTVVERIGDRPAVATGQGALSAPSPVVSGTGTVTPGPASLAVSGTTPASNPGSGNGADGSSAPIGEDLLIRMFRRDADAISLLALPNGDDGGADALVLLLYGYQRLMSRSAVNGYTLIRAAKQSGVNIPRVDTVMAKRKDYVLAAGAKRGRVYSLNNRGVAYAEGVLRRTLE
jgi:hypothetical protein